MDPSFPMNHSLDGISPAFSSLQYASTDNAVDIIMHLDCGIGLVKIDLSSAYRIVPVHPNDQPLLSIYWQGNIYVD